MAGIDEEERKLFAGGLPQECTQDDLKVSKDLGFIVLSISL